MIDTLPVGLLMRPDSGYYRGILRGIKRYADDAGHPRRWIFGMVAYSEDLPHMARHYHPAGVLAYIYGNERPETLQALGVPVVNFANSGTDLNLPSVNIDDVAVGRMAAEHLLERRFRHFAFVGCPRLAFSNQREEGFVARLAEAGYECQVFHDPQVPSAASVWAWTPDTTIQQWLGSLPRLTGMLAANDAAALRLSEICRQTGIRIPEEIALLGVDDDDLFCGLAHPALSSIKTPLERIGYEAASLLDRLMAGGSPPETPLRLPPVRAVTRRSTDILAIEDEDLVAAIRYIHENAQHPIGVQDVLREVPMSRRALERKCRAALGRSPLEELLRIRLQRVQGLLSESDLPMWAIAEQCGFASGKQLSTTFHQQLGITPSAYRRQHREGAAFSKP
jgi:LacI family transcriptional regulator